MSACAFGIPTAASCPELESAVPINSYKEGVQVGRRAKIKRAIIDKNVVIPQDAQISYDAEADKKRFFVSESGIVVIPKGMRLE
jgi:ADP-glucose pyrophosphorylase